MNAPTVALVAVASPVEAGGDRGEAIIRQAKAVLECSGLSVIGPDSVVWGSDDVVRAVRSFGSAKPEILVIVHCSWVVDALQFQLTREFGAPVLLWALPYPETYSLASVKHFSSVARSAGLFHRWGYGEVDQPGFVRAVAPLARAAKAAGRLRRSRAALMAARSTWRTGGPQDMTYDDWDLGDRLGVTLLHLPLEQLVEAAKSETDETARVALSAHAKSHRDLELLAERSLFAAKVYLATLKTISTYGLDGLAVACYPTDFGLVNLAASWLADEGVYLDPEGDVGHTVLANAMIGLRPAPVALAEPVLVDGDRLLLRHEGSSAASLAVGPDQVHVTPLGDTTGTAVEFPYRPMDVLTAASLAGRRGEYKLWLGRFASVGIPPEEWNARGRGFLAALRPEGDPEVLIARMFETGMDHHLLLQEGDSVAELRNLAEICGVTVVPLNE
ncbi:MAG: hypothetical protein ABSA21_06150 [Candidatus Limnocylindrales bacterium]